MSDHVRKQIRDAVVLKVTNLATTQDRVLVGRTRPLARDFAPTLLVYTTPAESGGQERAQPISMSYPRRIERTMRLTLMGRVQQGEPPDDVLDQIASEVEVALGGDPKLGGLVKDSALIATMSSIDAAGDRHDGSIRIDYSILYHTIENAPDVAA